MSNVQARKWMYCANQWEIEHGIGKNCLPDYCCERRIRWRIDSILGYSVVIWKSLDDIKFGVNVQILNIAVLIPKIKKNENPYTTYFFEKGFKRLYAKFWTASKSLKMHLILSYHVPWYFQLIRKIKKSPLIFNVNGGFWTQIGLEEDLPHTKHHMIKLFLRRQGAVFMTSVESILVIKNGIVNKVDE